MKKVRGVHGVCIRLVSKVIWLDFFPKEVSQSQLMTLSFFIFQKSQIHDFDLTWLFDFRNKSGVHVVEEVSNHSHCLNSCRPQDGLLNKIKQ